MAPVQRIAPGGRDQPGGTLNHSSSSIHPRQCGALRAFVSASWTGTFIGDLQGVSLTRLHLTHILAAHLDSFGAGRNKSSLIMRLKAGQIYGCGAALKYVPRRERERERERQKERGRERQKERERGKMV